MEASPKLGSARSKLLTSDPEWLALVGQVAKHIGSGQFHADLINLLGRLIHHDHRMIVRYSKTVMPEIVLSAGIALPVLETYFTDHSYENDPFLAYWRNGGRLRIVTLRDTPVQDLARYARSFMARARITDEVGVFLPAIGQSTLALFFERGSGRFTKSDLKNLEVVYPLIEGLHRAHIGRQLASLRPPSQAADSGLQHPTLILDRSKRKVYANSGWKKAERKIPALAAASDLAPAKASFRIDAQPHMLIGERLSVEFSFAPNGWIYQLVPSSSVITDNNEIDAAELALAKLSKRELDVLRGLIAGNATGAIAQRMGISKGTVKNHTLRIYRKLGTKSQRSLFVLFAPIRAKLVGRT